MKKCENCGNEQDGSYGSGRFCSKKCASSFSTKTKRKEINTKVSTYHNILRENNLKRKVKYCYSCNTEILGKKKLCIDCKPFYQYKKLFNKLNITDSNFKICNDKALKILKQEYFINKLSSCDIREKYKIQLNSLHYFFKKNGITLRNNSEAGTLCYENGKLTPQTLKCYKRGEHKTWDGKVVYLRSSYEFNYAKQLDEYKIEYEVESKRIKYFDSIKNKYRISVTDFYLPKLNMIVEIKSNYTLNLQNMKDRFKEYKNQNFKTKLIVDGQELVIN